MNRVRQPRTLVVLGLKASSASFSYERGFGCRANPTEALAVEKG